MTNRRVHPLNPNTRFCITTNPENYLKTWTSPLWWTGTGVVGMARFAEAQQFLTREEAEDALETIDPRSVAFYDLAVTAVSESGI